MGYNKMHDPVYFGYEAGHHQKYKKKYILNYLETIKRFKFIIFLTIFQQVPTVQTFNLIIF